MATFSIPSTFPKFWLKLGVGLIAGMGLFWFTVNLWTERKLPYIESALSTALHHPVTIEKVRYNLFTGFMFEDLEIRKNIQGSSPIHIKRVFAVPAFRIYPKPTLLIRKVIFEKPRILFQGKPEDFFEASTKLKCFPVYKNQIGLVTIEVRLASFEVRGGKISVLLVEPKNTFRQDFEGVNLFVGKHWLQKNFASLRGYIAGKPDASFHIQYDMKNPSQKELDSNIRMDFHEFTAAYLNPHLGNRFKLPDKNLTASMKFRIRDGRSVEVKGKIRLPEIKFEGTFLKKFLGRPSEIRYALKGVWENERGDFSSVFLKSGDMEFNGRGDIRVSPKDGHYHFSLISSKTTLTRFKNFIRPLIPDSGQVQFHVQLEGDAKRFEPSLEAIFYDGSAHVEDASVTIDKIDGRLRISRGSIEINELWAFVNNVPIRLGGRWVATPRPHFQLELSTYPGQLPELKSHNPFNISLKCAGVWLENNWNGYLKFNQDDFDEKIPKKTVWKISFHELSPVVTNQQNALADFWRKAQWKCRSLNLRRQIKGLADENLQFSMADATFLVLADSQHLRIHLTGASFCGGKLAAEGLMDFRDHLGEIKASATDLDVTRVLRYLKKNYAVTGRLACEVAWRRIKSESLSDFNFILSNGVIGPNPAFIQWAEQTGIEALRSIRFRSFSGEAHYKNDAWELRSLSLDSDQTRMSADLKLRSKLISGILSVKFPAAVIRDSSELKWLMDFVRGSDLVDFDFKIAGNLMAPRVEWLGGEFKKKVGAALAPWMKIEFDKQMEKKLSRGSIIVS